MTPRGSFRHWLGALARNLFRGDRRDRELRAEVQSYVDLLTEEKTAAGLTSEAARRAARLEFGSLDAVTDETRRVRAGALLEQWGQDARYALRLIRRDRSLSLVAVLTLALGIGANTAIFSVINAVLLKPLPYSDPDRLVLVWERNPAIGKERDPVAPRNYQDWRAERHLFTDLGAFRVRSFALGRVADPEQLTALSLSSSVFRVLRAEAAHGRVFSDEEERQRAPVVVLAYDFWQRRFGGDRSLVGRPLTLNDVAFTVVGIMPPGFAFPDGNPVDLYTPLLFAPTELDDRVSHTLTVIGRLQDGVTVERAQADLGTLARRIAEEDPASNPLVTVAGAHDVLVEDVRLGLVILSATVGLVLLIACANVASLLLVRASSRRREIAMRAALGAERGRLVRQLLTESLVLAVMGGASGMLVAWSLLAVLVGIQPPDLPRLDQVSLDTTVLLFVTAATFVTGLAFGLIPALHAARPAVGDATRSTSHAHAEPARSRARAALVVAEVALSLVLLAGAALMVRSLIKLQDVSLGFQPSEVLTAQLLLPAAKYPIGREQFRAVDPQAGPLPDTRAFTFFAQLEERLERVPGIEAAGAVSALPLNPVGTDYDLPVLVVGKPQPRAGEELQADFRTATTGYFRTLRIPVLAGRAFNEFDGPNSAPVVIVNDTLARHLFPGENPVGQQLQLYGRHREIVGVVGSVRHHGFRRDPRPEMIVPYRQFQFGGMTVAVRSSLDRQALTAAIAQAVHTFDPEQPVYRVLAMDELLADSVAQPRFTTWLVGSFAALALILALVGVYGVTSYTVNQRAREIAVRLALGAQRHEVVRLVARQSLAYAALGVLIGLAGAAAATRFMTGLLFGVTATDPGAFGVAVAALGLTAVAATYIPAWRAARVAPATTLRTE
jgi:predicted permease